MNVTSRSDHHDIEREIRMEQEVEMKKSDRHGKYKDDSTIHILSIYYILIIMRVIYTRRWTLS